MARYSSDRKKSYASTCSFGECCEEVIIACRIDEGEKEKKGEAAKAMVKSKLC